MKYKTLLKDIAWTVSIAMVFGGGILTLNQYLSEPFLSDHQKGVFFVGLVLFALVFRYLVEGRSS